MFPKRNIKEKHLKKEIRNKEGKKKQRKKHMEDGGKNGERLSKNKKK